MKTMPKHKESRKEKTNLTLAQIMMAEHCNTDISFNLIAIHCLGLNTEIMSTFRISSMPFSISNKLRSLKYLLFEIF